MGKLWGAPRAACLAPAAIPNSLMAGQELGHLSPGFLPRGSRIMCLKKKMGHRRAGPEALCLHTCLQLRRQDHLFVTESLLHVDCVCTRHPARRHPVGTRQPTPLLTEHVCMDSRQGAQVPLSSLFAPSEM